MLMDQMPWRIITSVLNQTAKPLIWEEYERYIRVALTGEKRNICVTIEEILA